ncbi:MAG: vanadium-dependent haloperoxidase [Cyanobacteria bacterium J06649_5]
MESRKKRALEGRIAAAKLAYDRMHPQHIANGDELKYRFEANDALPERQGRASHLANYTKGLPHHDGDGLVCDPADYQKFIQGIDSGDPRDFQDTPLGPKVVGKSDAHDCDSVLWESHYTQTADKERRVKEEAANKTVQGIPVRAWESAGAGLVFDLEGPDAQSVTMPPAPDFDSDEFIGEVAEVYEMALLRDVPFAQFNQLKKVSDSLTRLNNLPWFNKDVALPGLSEAVRGRRRVDLNAQNAFRGNSVGDTAGPYISQFLCLGTPELGDNPLNPTMNLLDGNVSYGAMRFDNKVRIATEKRDYMTTWQWWLDVQNGADLRGLETYVDTDTFGSNRYRFIATPRDLATYVHYDALYQAYFNACLFMLAIKVPFDPGIPFQGQDLFDHQQGFAHFGGPHILSLVTEVATRALKAVRYQKFNIHRRLRPEAVGGRIHKWCTDKPNSLAAVDAISQKIGPTLEQIVAHNAEQNKSYLESLGLGGNSEFGQAGDTFLLPMAFAEGSPMHPSYGAGHATVAGACVTILKAFFDHGYVLPKPYVISNNGTQLDEYQDNGLSLTIEGELNKLASNIAIGRDWAGVHYFTDYYESLRMGEKIAIGILEEQKLTYGENFSMTVPLFSGGSVRI